jgi:DNA polymerase elongation subunit (family B)
MDKDTIDTTKSVCFQIIDWHQEDVLQNDEDSDSSYDSDGDRKTKYKSNTSEYVIYIFGKDQNENTYSLKVESFTPYFYVKVPDCFKKQQLNSFENWVRKNLKGNFNRDTKTVLNNKKCLLRCTLHKKKKFRHFDKGKKYKYIRLVFKNLSAAKKAMDIFQNKEYNPMTKRTTRSEKEQIISFISPRKFNYELSDSMIDPLLKFIHHRDISTVGWINIKGEKYNIDYDTKTTCTYNIRTKWNNIKPVLEDRDNSKIKILGYDIECDSSHGDFPLAKKDYIKPAREIFQYFLRMQKTGGLGDKSEFVKKCLLKMFSKGDDENQLGKIFTKHDLKTSKNLIDKVSKKVSQYLCISETTHSIKMKAHNTRCINILNKEFNDNFPPIEGDKTIQIGISLMNYGEKIPYKNYMLTLKGCNPLKDCETICYEKEADILLKFRDIINEEDIDIITGWNTDGFDTPFLVKRSQELNIQDEFCKLSRFTDFKSEIKTKQKKSAIGQLVTMEYIQIPGRIQMDLLPLVQKSKNLASYKLEAVSAEFMNGSVSKLEYNEDTTLTKVYSKTLSGLNVNNFIKFMEIDGYLDNKYLDGQKFEVLDINLSDNYFIVKSEIKLDTSKNIKWCLGKDDVSPQDIFRLQKGSNSDRYIIAKYCLMDVILVLELMNKLDLITNNIGMANVCKTPLSWIIHRGQGVKILSLIAYFLKNKNYVIPLLHKDTFDKEGYEGAVVLDPKPGIYIDKPVAVLDFGSLYPSSMIECNISHETIINDDKYEGIDGAELLDELGYDYKDITYDVFKTIYTASGAVKGKVKVGEKIVRYVQYRDGSKGILPEVLRYLLTSRKNTRKRAKFKTITCEDGTKYSGMYDKDNNKITNLEETIDLSDKKIIEVKDTYNDFQKKVLDGLQLGFKVTANSLYGQVGAKTSDIYYKELAASTTAVGRDRLLIAKDFCLDRSNYPHKLDTGEIIYLQNEIIYGDTDSVFVYFQPLDGKGNILKGREARVKAIELGLYTEKKIANILDKPQVLEYEKTLDPFVLLSKKRYVGMLYETNPDKGKLKSMGIVLKRRDNAPIVKVIYGEIIDIIMSQKKIKPAVNYFRRAIRNLVNGKFNLDTLIISKSLSAYYKDPDRIAHKVLADRMAARDPGNKPQVGTRVPFIYIEKDKKLVKLQGDRIETPAFIKEHGLKPDYGFYITNQIMKPVTQIFSLCLNEIPNFRKDIKEFDNLYDKYIKSGKTKNEATKKMFEAKRKEAEKILLSDILRVLDNKKKRNTEITKFFKVVRQNPD